MYVLFVEYDLIYSVYIFDKYIYIYIYINVWKSSQRMKLRDVGSETSANDSVQTNKTINKRLKCRTTTPKKKTLKYNKNNYKSTKRL